MRTIMLLSVFAATGLFFFVQAGKAGEWNQELTLTFNHPVAIPGHVLEPGTYVFELGLGNTSQYENIVRVYNKGKDHLYGMFLTVPDDRLTRSNKPILEFSETPPGSPEAIYAWFYPQDKTGHEFVYPRSEALRLAKANNRPVASMPDNTNIANEDALKQAHVDAVTPGGKEVETITVFGTPAH
ncbi:MAG TPA: hypothetical protein VME17_07110 [Bryobacteraceae bacterium]|nr:hypothetical protein [Bryobacteraceae bacterium]